MYNYRNMDTKVLFWSGVDIFMVNFTDLDGEKIHKVFFYSEENFEIIFKEYVIDCFKWKMEI